MSKVINNSLQREMLSMHHVKQAEEPALNRYIWLQSLNSHYCFLKWSLEQKLEQSDWQIRPVQKFTAQWIEKLNRFLKYSKSNPMCARSSTIVQINYVVSLVFDINLFNLIIAYNAKQFWIWREQWFKVVVAYSLFRFFDFFCFIIDLFKVKSLFRFFIKLPEPFDWLNWHAQGGVAFWFKAMLQPIIFFSENKNFLSSYSK